MSVRAFFALFVVSALVMSVSVVSAGKPVHRPDPESLPETTPLGLQRSYPGYSIEAAYSSPAGCIGKSNYPHQSSVLLGIKGVSQIDCNYAVEKLRTTAQLWRKRWWGYQKVGTKGDNTNYLAYQVKASGYYGACEENRWRLEGEHWSWESSGIYYGHTWAYNDVTCLY